MVTSRVWGGVQMRTSRWLMPHVRGLRLFTVYIVWENHVMLGINVICVAFTKCGADKMRSRDRMHHFYSRVQYCVAFHIWKWQRPFLFCAVLDDIDIARRHGVS